MELQRIIEGQRQKRIERAEAAKPFAALKWWQVAILLGGIFVVVDLVLYDAHIQGSGAGPIVLVIIISTLLVLALARPTPEALRMENEARLASQAAAAFRREAENRERQVIVPLSRGMWNHVRSWAGAQGSPIPAWCRRVILEALAATDPELPGGGWFVVPPEGFERQIIIVLDRLTWQQLRIRAEARGLSVAEWCRWALQRYIMGTER